MNIKLMLEIINELESKVSIAGGKGYSAGKIYPAGIEKPGYGEVTLPVEEETYTLQPVEISKVFKK